MPFGAPLEWEVLRNHRQVLDNGYLTQVETAAWGTVWTGGPPWTFSKTPARTDPTPMPGEHTFTLQAEVEDGAEEDR